MIIQRNHNQKMQIMHELATFIQYHIRFKGAPVFIQDGGCGIKYMCMNNNDYICRSIALPHQ